MNSDEQTRLLQEILEVQKEQLAFSRQNSEELKTMQRTALAGQSKGLRMSRFVIVFMILAIGLVIASVFINSGVEENPAKARPGQESR